MGEVTRLFGLLVLSALLTMALYSAGVISWAPTPWETHAAKQVTQTAQKAAKAVGVKVNLPPKPPGTQATTTMTTAQQPHVSPQITSLYCGLENVPSGTEGCQ